MRLLLVLSTLALAGLAHGVDYESFQGLTSVYRLHSERVTWDVANRICTLEGGHLLVINSEDEATTISSQLFGRIAPFNPPLAWRYDLLHVGTTDKAEEGVWRTVLGDTLAEAGYDVWRKAEPNNYGNIEHCGAIGRAGEYSDLQCNDVNNLCPFICEKEGKTSTTTAPRTTSAPPTTSAPRTTSAPITTLKDIDIDVDIDVDMDVEKATEPNTRN